MTHPPRTLLINPTITSRTSARFPLALLHLAAALDRSGESRIIDGNVDRDFVNDTVHQVQALPPEMLLLLAVVILAGLYVLKRAF